MVQLFIINRTKVYRAYTKIFSFFLITFAVTIAYLYSISGKDNYSTHHAIFTVIKFNASARFQFIILIFILGSQATMDNQISLTDFLAKVKNKQKINFNVTIQVISNNYHYQTCEFTNGLADNCITNAVGTNEGSCKIFAFAKINQLNQQQTLNLFGDFYTKEVLDDPQGSSHQNIRNFMLYGWEGIHFTKQALKAK